MKIPIGASQDVQTSFREVWQVLDRLTTQDLNLQGRRIINLGNAIASTDAVSRRQADDKYSFDVFYQELQRRGLVGTVTGKVTATSSALVEIVTSAPAPKATDTGKLFFETDTGSLKFCNGTGYTTIAYQGISGTYANRPAATGISDGVTYYATDVNTLFIANTGVWVYVAGYYIGYAADRPTLAASDVGFRYHDLDIGAEIFWNGTEWVSYLMD